MRRPGGSSAGVAPVQAWPPHTMNPPRGYWSPHCGANSVEVTVVEVLASSCESRERLEDAQPSRAWRVEGMPPPPMSATKAAIGTRAALLAGLLLLVSTGAVMFWRGGADPDALLMRWRCPRGSNSSGAAAGVPLGLPSVSVPTCLQTPGGSIKELQPQVRAPGAAQQPGWAGGHRCGVGGGARGYDRGGHIPPARPPHSQRSATRWRGCRRGSMRSRRTRWRGESRFTATQRACAPCCAARSAASRSPSLPLAAASRLARGLFVLANETMSRSLETL